MSRNRRPRMPQINNSGKYRTPTNVYVAIDDDPGEPFEIHFYEFELPEIAEQNPNWNIFVKEEGRTSDDAGVGES